MPAHGVRSDIRDVINRLTTLLTDAYPYELFALIKEIVQNSDDAEAEVLHVGVVPAAPGDDSRPEHPLLSAPAVFFVNNRGLKPKDKEALSRIELNWKAGDAESVGKYGLGLKSLFHLGEVIFYMYRNGDATEHRTDSAPDPELHIFNPWHPEAEQDWAPHQEWDVVADADRQYLTAVLGGLVQEPPWFCLWVPLRQPHHCESCPPIVQRTFDGHAELLDELDGSTLPLRIAQMFPLLRYLNEVHGWCVEVGETRLRELFCIRPNERFRRTRFKADETKRGEARIGGEVIIERPSRAPVVCITGGVEVYRDDPLLTKLKEHPSWPTRCVQMSFDRVPEKCYPHAAVYFVGQEGQRSGGLTVWRSIFQPLSQRVSGSGPTDAQEFALFVHGYSFVDAGRRALKGLDAATPQSPGLLGSQDGEWVREQWNRTLNTHLTLPLLPKALHAFVTTSKRNDDAVRQLTKAVQATHLFRRGREAVCSGYQWIYRLSSEGGTWALVDAGEAVWALPEPPEDDPDIWQRVLPGAASFVEAHPVTFRGYPCLTRSDARADWRSEDVAEMLQSVPRDLVTDGAAVKYLRDFVAQVGATCTVEVVTQTLVALLSAWFTSGRLGGAEEHRGHLTGLVGCVPPGARLKVPLSDRQWDDHHAQLAAIGESLAPHLVLVPENLEPKGSPSERTPTPEMATAVMRATGDALARDESAAKALSPVVVAVLDKTANRQRALEECSEVRLFSCKDAGSQNEPLCTYSELKAGLNAGTLYLSGSGSNWAQHLASALTASVLLIRRDPARVLFGEGEVPACSMESICDLLATNPQLAEPEDRVALLQTCLTKLGADPPQEWREAVRYLLHGDRDLARTRDTVLYLGSDADDVWGKLGREALMHVAQTAQVPDVLAAQLTPFHREQLEIHCLDRESVPALVQRAGPGVIQGGRFSADELARLIREYPHDDDLKAMRIHRGADGGFHAIDDDRTYFEADFVPSEALPAGITLLVRSEDGRVAACQERLAPRLTPDAAIRLVMNLEHGSGRAEHWPLVMEALQALPDRRDLDEETSKCLRDTPWLPLAEGGIVAPRHVLRHDELLPELVDRLSGQSGSLVSVVRLKQELRDHGGYKRLADRFTTGDRALRRLADHLQGHPHYCIGIQVPGDLPEPDEEHIQALVAAFREGPEGLDDVSQLLEAARAPTGKHLLEKLGGDVAEAERFADILQRVQRGAEQATGDQKEPALQLLEAYLRAVVRHRSYRRVIGAIRLPNRTGQWKSTRELCAQPEGIDPEDVVDARWGAILERRVGQLEDGQVSSRPDETGSAARKLAAYFEPWERYGVSREQIGAFLSALGDDPGILKLARAHLGKHSLEDIREDLRSSKEREFPAAQTLRDCRVEIEIPPGETMRVPALDGSVFEARRASGIHGELFRVGRKVKRGLLTHRELTLLDFPLGSISPSVLSELLRDSFVKVLHNMYRPLKLDVSDDPDATRLWKRLGAEQMDIRVAQRQIVSGLQFYLRQIAVHDKGELAEALRELEHACRRVADFDVRLETATGQERMRLTDKRREAYGARQVAETELLRVLSGSPSVQDTCLQAVRNRMEQQEYRAESVPFELLQNADDAVVEVERLMGEDVALESREFVVWQRADTVSFAHWGRRINQYGAGARDLSDLGYGADLEKMLAMHASEKGMQEHDAQVTGKFGLGFKSVLLVTDRPQVMSGQLAFAVVGGLWPEELSEDERARLHDQLGNLGPTPHNGTIIELPFIRESCHGLLDRFRRLAHIQVGVARRIRTIRFIGEDGAPQTLRWEEQPVLGLPGIARSTLRPLDGEPQPVLCIRADAGNGTVLLGLGPTGFTALPPEIPTFWVTAPISEETGAGVVVNGDFAVHAGRSQLARSSGTNAQVAARIGQTLGERLCALFEAVQDRDNRARLREELGLSEECEAYEFWRSLFELLTEHFVSPRRQPSEQATELLQAIVWGVGTAEPVGLRMLCARFHAVPSGLSGPYQRLVKLRAVKHVVKGQLARDGELFAGVADWPELVSNVPPKNTVHESVWKRLCAMAGGQGPVDAKEVTLPDVVGWAIEGAGQGKCMEPESAERLGRVVTRKVLHDLETGTEDQRKEAERLRDLLKSVEFRTQAGGSAPAPELLVARNAETDDRDAGAREEEQRRAAFAPPGCLLNDEYGDDGIAYFLACRPQMSADVERMAQWSRAAKDDARREAVLRYLLDGEHRPRLGELLADDLPGWMDRGIVERHLPGGFAPDEGARLHVLLKPSEALRPLGWVPEGDGPDQKIDASVFLSSLWDRWQAEGAAFVREYEQSIYPGGRTPQLTGGDPKDVQTRCEWLKLLLLGMCHRMGRTQLRSHRGFLEKLQEKEWLTKMADGASTPEDWIGILDEYIKQEEEEGKYYEWMRNYPGIRWLAVYLEDYCKILDDADKMDVFTPEALLRPRENRELQGTAIAPPPIDRVLGIGACFVIRELARLGHIKRPDAHPYCYVPSRRVRRLIDHLGGGPSIGEGPRWDQSKRIHRFLCDELGPHRATFGGAFDLPLIWLCEKKERQIQLGLESAAVADDEPDWE